MLYPPFCDICVVGFSGLSETHTEKAAKFFEGMLSKAVSEYDDRLPLVIYRATACEIAKVNDSHEMQKRQALPQFSQRHTHSGDEDAGFQGYKHLCRY